MYEIQYLQHHCQITLSPFYMSELGLKGLKYLATLFKIALS